MKIMIIYSGGFTILGGIERVALNMINYATQHNNSFELVSISNSEELQKEIIEEFKQFNIIRYKSKTNSRVLKIFSRLIFGINHTKDWKIISDVLRKNKNIKI